MEQVPLQPFNPATDPAGMPLPAVQAEFDTSAFTKSGFASLESIQPDPVRPEPVTLPDDIRKQLTNHMDQLNVLPALASRALEMSRDPDCSMSEFSSLVERDVKMATDILRMANSVVFSNGQKIASLHNAVVRLGFRHCRNLILSSSVTSLMKRLTVEEGWVRDILWRHSFLTGLIAVNINRQLNLEFFGEEFTAGLVHDFGRTLLAFCRPRDFGSFDPLDFDESEHTPDQETAVAGTNHVLVGAWFATHNELPSQLYEAIRYHHNPLQAVNHRRLVALITLSDEIANFLQRSETDARVDLDSLAGLAALQATGVNRARAILERSIQPILQQSIADASVMMDS